MATQFMQPDGVQTLGTQTFGPIQFSTGTIFLPSQAAGPVSSTANTIVTFNNYDGTTYFLKNTGGNTIDANGVMSGEVVFSQILDQSTGVAWQNVAVNPGTTNITINLALGTLINLTHDENVTVNFQNVPIGYVTPIVIKRIKANNTTPRTMTFASTLNMEGKQKLVFSNTANAIDLLYMYINVDGQIYSRLPVPALALSSGSVTQYSVGTNIVTQSSQKALTSGTIVSLTSAGSFVTTDVAWDGANFTSPVTSLNNTVGLMYYTQEAKSASTGAGVVAFDCNNGVFGALTMDANVTSLAINNIPSPNGVIYTIFVKHANDTTTRNITWGSNYKYDTAPTLTQTANAVDIIVITSLSGTSVLVQCFQNFGVAT